MVSTMQVVNVVSSQIMVYFIRMMHSVELLNKLTFEELKCFNDVSGPATDVFVRRL
jgi:hypothetical protein